MLIVLGLVMPGARRKNQGPRAAAAGGSAGNRRELLATAIAGELIISEFRLQGPNGFSDEFIEIYNASGADHTVMAASGTGYGLAASDGVTRCSIPNGTVLPNTGHYLCVNSAGYSLASYPAGNGTTATGDATYTTEITDGEDPDGAGGAPPLPREGIALQQQHGRRQLLACQPARRRRANGGSQYAVQGRHRPAEPDAVRD